MDEPEGDLVYWLRQGTSDRRGEVANSPGGLNTVVWGNCFNSGSLAMLTCGNPISALQKKVTAAKQEADALYGRGTK